MRRGPLLALAAALAALLTPADAQISRSEIVSEKVVAALSQNRVSITANFSGSEIFVFGAVKREAPAKQGRLDVIVEITGPTAPVRVRRKDRLFGIWVNHAEVEVDQAPSFYALAATGPLDEVLTYTEDLRHRIGIDHQVRMTDPGPVTHPQEFRRAVMRLRQRAGLYFDVPWGVQVVDGTLFTTHIGLPSNLVEGDYTARVFLLHDRQVTDVFRTVIDVRKVGLERWVYTLSRERPALYGALSILLALAAGWTASEAFRMMRR